MKRVHYAIIVLVLNISLFPVKLTATVINDSDVSDSAIRHITSEDFLIENNTLSLAFDIVTASELNIDMEEYDSAVQFVQNTNTEVQNSGFTRVIRDVFVLQSDDSNYIPELYSHTIVYGGTTDVLLDVTCNSQDGFGIQHVLFATCPGMGVTETFNTYETRGVFLNDVTGFLELVYYALGGRGSAYIIAYDVYN